MRTDRILLFAAGAGIGAAAMAFLDPGRGSRRRSWIRDKMVRGAHLSNRVIDKKSRHFQNETFGALAEKKAQLLERDIPDNILEERVKAQIGHVLSECNLSVHAHNGHVILEGAVLRGEKQKLADRLDVTRGVKSYDLLVSEHESSRDFSNSQEYTWPEVRSA